MILIILLLHSVAASSLNDCETFGFASYYASDMVLQRSPSRATVWGYAIQEGDNVTVTIAEETYSTIAEMGPTGRPQWTVKFQAREASEVPATITASSGECSVSLHNVLFGDVYVCAGQSNMVFRLENIDDPEPDIEDVVNYPSVRSLNAGEGFSTTPMYDLTGIIRNWAVPTQENMRGYSAICWLFGKRLYQQYGRPVGLIHVASEGTRIQAWSSMDVINACFPDGPGDGIGRNAPTALFNGQIHPLFPLSIYGALYYQGESDLRNTAEYGCAIREMIQDWRQRWDEATDGETRGDFPFGQVQLAPRFARDEGDAAFAAIRWAQTGHVGYLPNEEGFDRVFMAVAADLPDFDSPEGAIHPRYKRQIADRLALAAFHVAYNDSSLGTFQGPFPTQFTEGPGTIIVTFDDGAAEIELRGGEEEWAVGYEVCCGCCGGNATICLDGDERWHRAEIDSHTDSSVTLTTGCASEESVLGLRYIWRESPCELEKCPIYSRENSLPAPPYRYDGLIEGNMKLQK